MDNELFLGVREICKYYGRGVNAGLKDFIRKKARVEMDTLKYSREEESCPHFDGTLLLFRSYIFCLSTNTAL